MDGILSRSAGPTHIPRILMAENHFSTMESLIQTLGDRRFHLDFDVCTSHHSAVRKLLASPYQLIISGVHLAELDDFLLLKRIQALEVFVPLVITATTGDKASARRLLEQGAFDLITTPLEHEQWTPSVWLCGTTSYKPSSRPATRRWKSIVNTLITIQARGRMKQFK